jgi:hypothetical protein
LVGARSFFNHRIKSVLAPGKKERKHTQAGLEKLQKKVTTQPKEKGL